MSFNPKRARRHRRQVRCVLLAASLVSASPALAVSRYYVGSDGANWNVAANWNTIEAGGGSTGVPANLDDVFVRGPLTRTVVFNTAVSSFQRLGTLQVDSSAAGAVSTISQTNITTQMRAANEHIGFANGGSGAYLYTGGNHDVSGSIFVGHGEGSSGQYTLGGTGSLAVGGSTNVGYSGTGTFTHTAGTHAIAGSLSLGQWLGSSGRYELSGGRLTAQNTTVGDGGVGTFVQTGGTHTLSQWLFIGNGLGSGRYNLDGGTLSLNGAGGIYLGTSSTGTFAQTGGSASIGGTIYMGYGSGGTGNLSLSGTGQFFVLGQQRIGYQGNGTVTQTGGTHTANAAVHIGSQPGSNGRYILSGGLFTVRGFYLVGDAGTAIVEQSGGSHVVESEMYVGASTGGVGRFTLSGTGALNVTGNQFVAYNGNATFTQTSGTNTVGQTLHVGIANTGTYAMSGGAMSPRRLWVRNQGTLAMSGGTIIPGEGIDIDGVASFAGGTTTIDATTRGILDFGHGAAFSNTSGLTINGSPQTLVIFPGGFNPQTQLAGYANTDGVTGFAGSTVVIPAGKTITGSAEVSNFMQVEGALNRASFLALRGGAAISGAGVVTLSEFSTDSRTSTLADNGSLSSNNFVTIGDVADGTFVQSGGALNANTLTLGFQAKPAQSQRGRGHYTLSGGSITASGLVVGNAGDGTFVQTGGTNTVTATLTIANSSGSTGTYTLAGGTLSVGKFVNKGTFIQTGGTLSAGSIEAQNNSTFMLTPGSGTTLKVNSVSVSGSGKVDAQDNALVVTGSNIGTAAAGSYTGIAGMIQSAHHGGEWDGFSGITTGMTDAADGLTSLGVATAGQTGYAGGTFRGVSVTANHVLVMYTYAGDANLDGFISGDDYTAIDFNAAVPGAAGWFNGDFNYDGVISGDDYSAIDFNIVAQGAPFPTGASAGTSGVTAVPEPAGIAVLSALLGLTMPRCRRRKLASSGCG